ncbi:DUF397 domain-containing protein [Lentzea sp. NEAU-D13]|uniref:DUF397 domain-containing protein n=1 Tax=Lentzea alba TaxID=2714351 RepID=A0A7C9S210_9PSEU|nr:DUF397 domain-containing protein [Lentzea alba]NGY65842.1 DUF397 domain-containing protein [Lentzea alba]
MAEWRKSSYSPTDQDCVEIGRGVGIRDSKAPAAHVPVAPAAWAAFLRSVSNRGRA